MRERSRIARGRQIAADAGEVHLAYSRLHTGNFEGSFKDGAYTLAPMRTPGIPT